MCSILFNAQSNISMSQLHNTRYQQLDRKVVNEEQAIASETRRYKQIYLNKALPSNNLQNFIKFSKELFLLLISHCKNMSCIAPDRVADNLQQISIIMDDIINKYHQVSIKLNDRYFQLYKNENKSIINGEICSVCSQQIKKVEIDQVKRSIMNQSYVMEKENVQDKKQQEDLQFFAELNDLMNKTHGSLLKNQIQIDLYQDVALNALKSLSTLKNFFTRDSLIIPNISWIEQARQGMRKMLKQNFNGKIPPWIEKMFTMFWALHKKEAMTRQKQIGIQTTSNANSQILQLKKKLYRSNEKLQKSQNRMQAQDHQLTNMTFQKKDLQDKIDYYKKELNKLLDQIETIKSENQSIKLRLNTNNPTDTLSKTQINEKDLFASLRSKKTVTNQDGSLPKIERPSVQKMPKRRDSLTSIKMFPYGPSPYKTQRDAKPQLKINIEASNLRQNEPIANTQPNSPTGIRQYHNENIKSTTIRQEQSQSLLDEEKKKIQEVSQHYKALVKSKLEKNGAKRYFSNTVNPDKFKDSLKRIARKTNKLITDASKKAEMQSIYRPCSQQQSKQEKVNGFLLRIFNYLQKEGYLIKITEQELKDAIKKIIKMDLVQLSSNQYQTLLESKFSPNNHLQRLSEVRKSWNQQTFNIHREDKPNILQQSKYFSIFNNEQNAYNYELSLTKNHFKGILKMSFREETLCQQLYEIINKIKKVDFNHYKLICSFLRYPYQVMKNDFGLVNIVNEMKYSNFHQYFQRLLAMHTKCKKSQHLCQHFQQFKQKLLTNL